jgi:hypothetical protein
MIIKLDEKEGVFEEIAKGKKLIQVREPIYFTVLKGGMSSGRASVAFGFVIGSNKFILAETSLRLFLTAAQAAASRFPEEAKDTRFILQQPEPGAISFVMRPDDSEIKYAIDRLKLDGSEVSASVIAFLEGMVKK